MNKRLNDHFRGTVTLAVLALASCVVALGLSLGRFDEGDEIAYRELMQKNDEAQEDSTYTSKQERLKVHKDLFFVANDQHLQLRLQSARVDLAFEHDKGQTYMVEHMHDVVCHIQEELFYQLQDGREAVVQKDGRFVVKHGDVKQPTSCVSIDDVATARPMQMVRSVKAKTAFYHYKDQTFSADDIDLTRFVANGHTIEEALYCEHMLMKGKAAKASYENNAAFEGGVVIEHALGTLAANSLVLPLSKAHDGLQSLHVQENVKFAFKEGGELNCSRADLDHHTLTGKFFGDAHEGWVTYREDLGKRSGGNAHIPLVFKSRRMDLQLASKEAAKEGGAKNQIATLRADEDVMLDYNENFIVSADHAIYECEPDGTEGEKDRSFPGSITMTAAHDEGVCRVSNYQGDNICAKQIYIDTVKRQLIFSSPKGVLGEGVLGDNSSQKISNPIEFCAGTLIWDDLTGVLLLSHHVEINQKGMGNLKTDEEVQVRQLSENRKKTLKEIKALGKTVLSRSENNQRDAHQLTCNGVVVVDHIKMQTSLFAGQDELGEVPEGNQVHFQDDKGEIFADRVFVKYGMADGAIVVSKIFLKGNVKIYNRINSQDAEGATLQYVLADQVEFVPRTNEMLFKSLQKGKRVLFFDKTNQLQISARALKIIRDQATKKEAIEGSGDVRFNLLESEFEQLRKRFSLQS